MSNIFTEEQMSKVVVGKTYMSWKEICEEAGIPYKKGSKSQSFQKIELSRFFEFSKQGRKYTIIKRKNNVENKYGKRFSQMDVDYDDYSSIGVYAIELDNNIFIGITTTSFRTAFVRWFEVGLKDTLVSEMMSNDARFFILEKMDDSSKEEMNEMANKYRNYYGKQNKYTIVGNRKGYVNSYDNVNNKDMLTCVYKIYIDNKCAYIGITTNINNRMYQHSRDKDWFYDATHVMYSDYINRNLARMYEIYYISKIIPDHNREFKADVDGFDFEMIELDFVNKLTSIGDSQ